MDQNATSTKPSGIRRFSFSSIRSNLSSNGGHSLPSPDPDASSSSTPAPHRTLHSQTRGSRPPTTGPSISRHRSKSSMDQQSQSSTSSSYFSRTMPSSVLHTVKRSLSLTRKSPPLETTPTYYGMTAEENVFNLSAAPPQQPLRAPPTFQQIASGLALRQPRPRDSKPIADPPRRPSLKKPSNSLLPTPPATAPASASSSFVKLRRFSSSSPTPGSVISSSSSATTSTSSSTSHRHTSNPVMARVTKHKLSLSFSALTGGGRRGASDNTNSSGSLSSLDAAGAKKAVRFTDSPEPTIIPDGVAATSKSQHVRASRQAPTYEVAFPGAPRPNLQHRQTDGTFVEKAASRLFSR